MVGENTPLNLLSIDPTSNFQPDIQAPLPPPGRNPQKFFAANRPWLVVGFCRSERLWSSPCCQPASLPPTQDAIVTTRTIRTIFCRGSQPKPSFCHLGGGVSSNKKLPKRSKFWKKEQYSWMNMMTKEDLNDKNDRLTDDVLKRFFEKFLVALDKWNQIYMYIFGRCMFSKRPKHSHSGCLPFHGWRPCPKIVISQS